jgi:ribonuclease-3
MSDRSTMDWKELALIHSSWAHANGGDDNERLEFLGDAILGQIVSHQLFLYFPDAPEGDLSRVRARLVCTEQLATLSREMGLDQRVRLAKEMESTGGRQGDRLLAGLFEAWLAALFLEDGMAAAEALVQERVAPLFETVRFQRHPKVVLQEWADKRHGGPPSYKVVESKGPDHAREFLVQALIGENVIGEGWGRSKQEASKEAARLACLRLDLQ